MKNFRKVLALILVVATLFSFVAMASAKTADEYKDYADVNYVQAVDVLTAIGINEGYDGKFHPADTIDRDEVAAMVARLLNGADFDADLYVGADKVFADVKGQWSEGYVTYCAQLGIIAGRNSTTFDPDGKVTGVEVLKMLLCALGYNAAEQGYTGANWQVNVVRDAKKSELLIEGVDPYAPATRDEVAQYFLNALVSRMVIGYLGEGIIDLTNSIWVDLVDADHVLDIIGVVTPDSVVTTDLGQFEVAYCNAIISGTFLWQSIKGLDVDFGTDCYARPGLVWSFGDWSKFYAFAPVYSTTTAFSATVLEDYEDDDVQYFMNGFPVDEYRSGNGTLTEVFEVAGEVRVCGKEAFIGKVTHINSYNDNVTIGDVEGREWVVAGLTDVAKGDIVLFHICNGDNDPTAIEIVGGAMDFLAQKHYDADAFIHDCTVLDPVVVDVEYGHIYADINDSNVTASGKTYSYNNNYMLIIDESNVDDETWDNDWMNAAIDFWGTYYADAKFDLYLDEYGYIMWAEPHTDAVKYAYAVAEEATLHEVINGVDYDEYGKPVADVDYTAGLAKYDGEAGVVEVETEAVDAGFVSEFLTLAKNAFENDWTDGSGVSMLFKYAVDEDGKYAGYADSADFAAVGTVLGKESWVLDPAKKVAADNDTLFMIRTTDGLGNYTYKEVVGYKNLDRDYIANNVILNTTEGRVGVTNIQYFVDGEGFATHVFIDAHYTSAAAGTFMPISLVEWYAFDWSIRELYAENYKAYTALIDGTEGIVLVSNSIELVPGFLYTNAVEFIDVAVCGEHKLPLYVYADLYAPVIFTDPIKDFYLHKDNAGEMWVWTYDTEIGWFGDYRLAKCAEGFKVYTVLTNADGDIETVIDETSIVLTADLDEALEGKIRIAYGYVIYNDAGEVVAVYRIANNFLAGILG